MCDGHVATIVGTPGADRIHGTPRSDVIVALGGDDGIMARSGSRGDIICAGHGNDTIYASDGDDSLFGGYGNDLIAPGLGHDAITGGPGEDAVYNSDGWDTIEGGYGNDYLESGGNSVVEGGPGLDSLVVYGGSNRLWGGPGNDQIGAFEDDDRAGASQGDLPGRNVVHGGPGVDKIGDFDPNDDIFGGSGDDFLFGGVRLGSGQVLQGGPGSNGLIVRIARRAGHPRRGHITINLTEDKVVADGLTDRFSGRFRWLRVDSPANRATSWTIVGTAGGDVLESFFMRGPVVERGLAGNDTLITGGGDDVLRGGHGTDSGDADGGSDTCISIERAAQGQTQTHCELTTP
jgi:Ca2+-binding RTX toxin-like protein